MNGTKRTDEILTICSTNEHTCGRLYYCRWINAHNYKCMVLNSRCIYLQARIYSHDVSLYERTETMFSIFYSERRIWFLCIFRKCTFYPEYFDSKNMRANTSWRLVSNEFNNIIIIINFKSIWRECTWHCRSLTCDIILRELRKIIIFNVEHTGKAWIAI